MAEAEASMIEQAFRTPDGCKALLSAFREPLRRAVEYGIRNDTAVLEIDDWLIPALRRTEWDHFDPQLFAFMLCTLGALSSLLAQDMFELALDEVTSAVALLDEYGVDDIEMTPLGGRVMTPEEMERVQL